MGRIRERGNEEEERGRRKTLTIWQQNLNKSLDAQLDMLNSLRDRHDIICIQEPHFDFNKQSRATQKWIPVYPKGHDPDHPERTRALILVNRNIATGSWTRLEVDSADVAAIRIQTAQCPVRIFCIYNACDHSRSMN
ncbi:hypothetical protein FPV67DRAFT_1407513, partial [Lyophyllum atratum]